MAAPDNRRSIARFSVATADQLQSLLAAPLPLGLRETSSRTSIHRDLYFDTPEGALHARNVTCRLRYRGDGRSILSLKISPPASANNMHSEILEVELPAGDPAAALAGDSEPMRRCRAFADPASLRRQAELEVTRTVRLAHAGWFWRGRFEFSHDDVTVRHGSLFRTFQELKVTHYGRGGPSLRRVAAALMESHPLRTSPVTKLERAEAIGRRLEADELTLQIGPGRSVVVLALDEDSVALVSEGDRVRLPSGPGAGEAACRNTLHTWLQSRVGEPFLAGTTETPAGDRSVEVWIVRRIRRPTESSPRIGITWVPLESLAKVADSAAFNDPESRVAYQVVANAGLFPGWPTEKPARRRERITGSRAEAASEPADNFLDGPESELAFIWRVLALAEDARVPVLERVRYISIVSANLDEFYMGSAGSLRRGPEEIGHMLDRQRAALDDCLAVLARYDVRVWTWNTLAEAERDSLRQLFRDEVLPLLTPRAITVSPGHPFPTVPPLTLAFAVMLGDETGPAHYAYLKLPPEVPRFLETPGGFLPLEELVRAELHQVYPDRSVSGAWLFRITRLSDLDLDESRAGNLLQAMEEDLDRRRKNPLVRVEVAREMPVEVLDLLLTELRLESRGRASQGAAPEIQRITGLMVLSDVRQLADATVPGGSFPRYLPRNPFRTDESIWEQIRSADCLVHHPYDDFGSTVVRLISDAAADPEVTGIKLMLYRAGDRSPLVEALEKAARAGKDVAAFVELKARFDEARNVLWVKRLEAAGVQVVYGLVGLKNHSKVALVIRREPGGLRRYVHLGTGNYHEGTARVYTDLGLFSADAALGEDVHDLFNQLTGTSGPPSSSFRKILVAPTQLLPAILQRIEREIEHAGAGRGGVIRAKINGLAEPEVIRALYRASQAGVEIDLLVRGICLLRPGVSGLSERIRVRSTLGRFLEHARIYHFGNGGKAEYFIASADWRPRNLRRRVEVAVPISDAACRDYLEQVLNLEFHDPTGWILQPDGAYAAPEATVGDPASAQQILQQARPGRS